MSNVVISSSFYKKAQSGLLKNRTSMFQTKNTTPNKKKALPHLLNKIIWQKLPNPMDWVVLFDNLG